MFSYKGIKEQLQDERRKNEALQAQVKEQEDAIIELAAIVAANEEAINDG